MWNVVESAFAAIGRRQGEVLFQFGTQTETVFLKFLDGTLIDASSSAAPKGQRLGEILVQQGALDQSALDAFLAAGTHAGARIGERLLMEGLIDSSALARARAFQVQQIFLRLAEAPTLNLRITSLPAAEGAGVAPAAGR